jgi:hypothetical protein
MGPLIVDSNFFIQAHRDTYPLDVATSFWTKINELAANQRIMSIDKVKAELNRNKDALTVWCDANLPTDFFAPSAPVIAHYAQVINVARFRQPPYNQRALDTFFDADEADAWLIAHALYSRNAIVTHETSQPAKIARVKIPDICAALAIRSITTIEMFRELGERF